MLVKFFLELAKMCQNKHTWITSLTDPCSAALKVDQKVACIWETPLYDASNSCLGTQLITFCNRGCVCEREVHYNRATATSIRQKGQNLCSCPGRLRSCQEHLWETTCAVKINELCAARRPAPPNYIFSLTTPGHAGWLDALQLSIFLQSQFSFKPN